VSDRTLVHDEAAGRYELRAGDAVLGFAAYLPAGPSVIVSHTEVDPAHKGEGVGSELVRATLDAIRASGKTVIPNCPFTAAYISRHPEYVDLVDPSLRGRFTTP
jgi:predicted GNAT family acetyltransferase